MKPYQFVRHLPAGGREVLGPPVQLDPQEVVEINRALVKTLIRVWPARENEPTP